jgi:hypothetical protein
MITSRNSDLNYNNWSQEIEFDPKYFFVPASTVGSNFIEEFEFGKQYEL